MKKKITNFILFVVISLITIIIILSTSGIETNKFNKLIIEKSSQGKNINLKLETIKFKIDPKKLSLFLETHNPEIMYKNLLVPVKSIKAYVDYLSLLRSDTIIKKSSILSQELDIIQINK